jgi:hypothetical protein
MEWYYDDNGTQVGPLTQEAFYGAVRAGKVLGSTKVWCQGWPDWKTYDEYQAAPQETAEAAASSGGSESSGGADPNKNLMIGVAVLIAAGAAFFFLKGGDPSCESACEKAGSVVSQEEDWSKKKTKKETRRCVGMCTEEKWSASMRTCLAGIKDKKDAERCTELEEKDKEIRPNKGKAECDKEKAMAEVKECEEKTDQKEAAHCMDEFQKKYSHCE